jgi:hypothetical protein
MAEAEERADRSAREGVREAKTLEAKFGIGGSDSDDGMGDGMGGLHDPDLLVAPDFDTAFGVDKSGELSMDSSEAKHNGWRSRHDHWAEGKGGLDGSEEGKAEGKESPGPRNIGEDRMSEEDRMRHARVDTRLARLARFDSASRASEATQESIPSEATQESIPSEAGSMSGEAAAESSSATTNTSASDSTDILRPSFASLPIRELKRMLDERGVTWVGCVEKSELVQRLVDFTLATEGAATEGAATGGATGAMYETTSFSSSGGGGRSSLHRSDEYGLHRSDEYGLHRSDEYGLHRSDEYGLHDSDEDPLVIEEHLIEEHLIDPPTDSDDDLDDDHDAHIDALLRAADVRSNMLATDVSASSADMRTDVSGAGVSSCDDGPRTTFAPTGSPDAGEGGTYPDYWAAVESAGTAGAFAFAAAARAGARALSGGQSVASAGRSALYSR